MKLIRLHVERFAAISEVDLEFGPGLNVLYGPNDLGKSTVVEAIRFALLLPHSSTHCEPYIGWNGGGEPTVELTFGTEAQRIWRVTKRFGKPGSSVLQESRNGRDFDNVESARKVDAKLREILCWGIPEPGGAHALKGLPNSFLATALLSTQADVSAILNNSLQEDPSGSGKERIAAALQAVAQDPLFLELLRKTQEQRDAAYTAKGTKSSARGSVFKDAADRLNEARREKERLQQIVEDSEGTERGLQELIRKRAGKQEQLATATADATNLELLARQGEDRSVAAGLVQLAEVEVRRIEELRTEADVTEGRVAELALMVTKARELLDAARSRQTQADAARSSAEETARAAESDPTFSDAGLRLRKTVAEQVVRDAELRIETIEAARDSVETATVAERELRSQQALAESARRASDEAEATEKTANAELLRCSLLERGLEIQAAEKQLKSAQAAVDVKAALEIRLRAASKELASLVDVRRGITVPATHALLLMRKLANELAAARGAVDVGIVVKVTPQRPLDLVIQKDGEGSNSISIAEPEEIEANTELEFAVPGLASFRVRGGRREAQTKLAGLEGRWNQEVMSHLVAAGVADLDGLSAKVDEAQQLDAGVKTRGTELKALQDQIASLADGEDALRQAADHLNACRTSVETVDLEALTADLSGLGADASAKLVLRRKRLSGVLDEARGDARIAMNAHSIAGERSKHFRSTLDLAVSSRDIALKAFPQGVGVALIAAQTEHAAHVREVEKVVAELTSLGTRMEARKKQIDAAQKQARASAEKAGTAATSAQTELEAAMTSQASEAGRLIELRRLRDAANLADALDKLREGKERYKGLPVPVRIVSDQEVIAAQAAAVSLKSELKIVAKEIDRAHGALEQVGGAVARERLSDATDAFEQAERLERETEADYEAWKLLLEQMKEADAAQASNLGLALVPGIADQFNELTRQRYQTVKFDAQLATEGVVVSGAVRSASCLSVGTREQLSTLFRLSLAEYLGTAIVLDDQLVQSDGSRMDWFRTLLNEKAHTFQIIVITCRPSDYLPAMSLVPDGGASYTDLTGEPIRAIDLTRALRRR